jgi:hypothetical protein
MFLDAARRPRKNVGLRPDWRDPPMSEKKTPEPTPQETVLQLISGAWATQAVYAAVRLDLAEKLAAGPRTAAEVAKDCGALPDRLERLFRTLSGVGVFRHRDDGRWENTAASSALRASAGNGLAATVKMTAEEHFLGWSRFHDCLKEPRTAFELYFGEPIFRWYAHQPALVANFQQAMREASAPQVPAIVAAYDTSDRKRIIDVGGGHGGLLLGLLSRAKGARGAVYDLEQGLAAARAAGLDHDARVDLIQGDFFQSVPAGGDLYALKYILHDWDDDRCVTILRHIKKGLAPGGRVIVCEVLVGPHNTNDFAKWMDLHMMAMPGGRERTKDEYAALFERAGMKLTRAIPTACPMWVLEAEAG